MMDVKCAMALNEVMRLARRIWEHFHWDAGIWAILGLLEISVEVLVGKTLPVTAYRKDKWSNGKEGGGAQKTSHGAQLMASQLKWSFRFRSANNASYCHHRHGGVTHKGQVTASARQNKKWASLQDDRSATSARTHTGALEHRIHRLLVHSLPHTVGRCVQGMTADAQRVLIWLQLWCFLHESRV